MPHLLKSANTPGKDLECILIFDPATQEYVLERQYSSFNFQRIRKIKSGKRSRSQDSVRSAPTEKEESSWSQDDDFDLDQAVAEAIDTPMGSPEVESHVESQVESHMETPKSPQSQPIEAGPRSLFNESDDGSSSVEG
jgi:hypothetical protein